MKTETEELMIKNEEFFLEVDYSISIKELLRLGKYDYIDSGIRRVRYLNANKDVENLKMKIFKFKPSMPNSRIISEMKEQDYRPANIIELLTLGYKHQDVQRFFAIVAISVDIKKFFTKHYSPYLIVQNYQRQVGLDLSIYGWDSYVRFLAVSK